MAKVTYEFDYYEDGDLIEIHQKALEMSGALDEIYSKIRTEFKHGDIEISPEMERFLDEIQEICYKKNVN